MGENLIQSKNYEINKINADLNLGDDFNDGPWANTQPVTLENYMGEKPKHFPSTQVKLLYNNENLFIFFKVHDNFVRYTVSQTNGLVCEDSCVEFFFTPNNQPDTNNYFNIETNCGGTILMHYNDKKASQRKPVDEKLISRIQIYHSMPAKVNPEIKEPTTWLLQYRLPFEIFSAFQNFTRPEPGTIWRANFYKCADKSSMPHWLTWNKVENPFPDFHLPEYFGILKFI
jgi:hypothetical protein